MTALTLSAAERRFMRAEAQRLDAVVAIGSVGLTAGVLREADAALAAHGLIKLRVHSEDRDERERLYSRLADELGAAPVQHIGKLLVLWRPIQPRRKSAPDDRLPGPKLVKVLKFSKSGNHRPQVRKIRLLGNQRLAAGGTIKRAKKRARSLKKRVQT